MAELDQAFLNILKDLTAGDPMDAKVKWISLTRLEISEELKKGFSVSRDIVRGLLRKLGYVKRKAQKLKGIDEVKGRVANLKKLIA